ncbi:MAG: formylglycine-generating enzyme family protein [bacterium]
MHNFGIKNNAKDRAEMVWVPEGVFSVSDHYGIRRDHQRARVTGYWIYKYDVTVAQYRAFCAATKHKLPHFPQPRVDDPGYIGSYFSWEINTGWDDPALQQHPIVNVTWDDAKAYADWAGVTLPTAVQWEYAASGTGGNNYPWGGTATDDDKYNGWDATKCANRENSLLVGKSTWPVGSFPEGASWCGAQDMAGNVWEWCDDWYDDCYVDDYFYQHRNIVTNPANYLSDGEYHVLRGGSWDYDEAERYLTTVYCGHNKLNEGSESIGFRCVSLSPEP